MTSALSWFVLVNSERWTEPEPVQGCFLMLTRQRVAGRLHLRSIHDAVSHGLEKKNETSDVTSVQHRCHGDFQVDSDLHKEKASVHPFS